MNYDHFLVPPHGNISLRKDYDPGFIGHFHKKSEVAGQLEAGVKQLAAYQDILYAQNTYAVLILFQAMDAAGKDSTIKHVMSGVNPKVVKSPALRHPQPKNSIMITFGER